MSGSIYSLLSVGTDFSKSKYSNATKLLERNELQKKQLSKLESVFGKSTNDELNELDEDQIRKTFRIKVEGENVPAPIVSFDELSTALNPVVFRNLKNFNFSMPTPVQMQAIPILSNKTNLLACSPTGSGKTLAYTIPIFTLHQEYKEQIDSFQAKIEENEISIFSLILVPTRELGQQILAEVKMLKKNYSFRSLMLTKKNINPTTFSKHIDLLITTPLLFHQLLTNGYSVKNCKYVCLDECDKLLEAQFEQQTDFILQRLFIDNPQRCLFSASLSPKVEEMGKLALEEHTELIIAERNIAAESIEQRLTYTGSEDGKLLAIQQLLDGQELVPPIMIFTQTKARATKLFKELQLEQIKVDIIHSDLTKKQREDAVRKFREGKTWALVCTDLVGRGLDFVHVSTVVNFDIPSSAIDYLHRIGRTGRAGRKGVAITLWTQSDADFIKPIVSIMRNSGMKIDDWLLNIKGPSQSYKRKLAKEGVKRKSFSDTPHYIRRKNDKRKNMIRQSKEKVERSKSGEVEKTGKDRRTDKKSTKSKKNVAKREPVLND
eukprot:TRINITY_DN2794_c0_g1_i1.p1 TRINITY_DN2794_c0_g1~~TRINITY_DN2794_c0_g1_i1.p1  ORF type:complete len:548 (-),score=143.96 TRINITY_DN2794_c0_g1_i1:39-1682(-)